MTRLALPNYNINKHKQNSVTNEVFWQLYVAIPVGAFSFEFSKVVLTLLQVAVRILFNASGREFLIFIIVFLPKRVKLFIKQCQVSFTSATLDRALHLNTFWGYNAPAGRQLLSLVLSTWQCLTRIELHFFFFFIS